jgi:hypothetical protein
MSRYEYVRLTFYFDQLVALNRLANEGWRVVSVQKGPDGLFGPGACDALLERGLPGEVA